MKIEENSEEAQLPMNSKCTQNSNMSLVFLTSRPSLNLMIIGPLSWKMLD